MEQPHFQSVVRMSKSVTGLRPLLCRNDEQSPTSQEEIRRTALVGSEAMRRIAEDEKWEEPLDWNRVAEKRNTRAQVFCGSMCDVMEDRRDLDASGCACIRLIEQTPFLDWILVTKRPEKFSKFLPQSWRTSPRHNVWLMTTCENQEWADKRIPELMKVPAVVYGISVEPMLGPITLPANIFGIGTFRLGNQRRRTGSAARPTQQKWLTDLRDQCVLARHRILL